MYLHRNTNLYSIFSFSIVISKRKILSKITPGKSMSKLIASKIGHLPFLSQRSPLKYSIFQGWVGLEYTPVGNTEEGLQWINQWGYSLQMILASGKKNFLKIKIEKYTYVSETSYKKIRVSPTKSSQILISGTPSRKGLWTKHTTCNQSLLKSGTTSFRMFVVMR